MNFKAYDILSSLVPGFLLLIVILNVFGIPFNKDFIFPYTAIAFLLGFINNALASWLEDFYFMTWGGKPSDCLLDGKDVWKIKFYHVVKVKTALLTQTENTNPTNDELFSIAMRKSNGLNTRVDDFNAMYAFSRALLTTLLFATIFLLIKHRTDWRYYATVLPLLFIVWFRTKQRAYYYSREVLNAYLR
jgi:hypothetical protein